MADMEKFYDDLININLYSDWIGDGECDDITNIAECNFDGNDCCQEPLIEGSCLDCQCLVMHMHNVVVIGFGVSSLGIVN